jgi:hypothetical protein
MAVPEEIEGRNRDRARDPARLEEADLSPRTWNRAPPYQSFEGNSHYHETVLSPVQSRIFRNPQKP